MIPCPNNRVLHPPVNLLPMTAEEFENWRRIHADGFRPHVANLPPGTRNRRTTFRTPAVDAARASVSLKASAGQSWHGRLLNLSLNGLLVDLEEETGNAPVAEQELTIDIKLGNLRVESLRGQVKRRHGTMIGIHLPDHFRDGENCAPNAYVELIEAIELRLLQQTVCSDSDL